jgi:outer membrane biosynthesis protein TonB
VSEGNQAANLAADAAEAVRRIVAEAEERAAEIVREAEAEATRIRERAEVDANEGLESARHALDELRGRLEGGGDQVAPGRPPAEAVPPTPPPPEAETPAPEPVPEPMPAPEPVPEPVPPGNGDDAAARLMAMKLAIDGKGREEIAYELDAKFGAEDRTALLDDVLARAGK